MSRSWRSRWQRVRAGAGDALSIAALLAGLWTVFTHYAASVARDPPPAASAMDRIGQRFAPVRDAVPPRARDAPIRYVRSQERAGIIQRPIGPRRRVAQYHLAPLKLVRTEGTRWVLADLDDDAAVDRYADEHGYVVVHRFGGGLALLESDPP